MAIATSSAARSIANRDAGCLEQFKWWANALGLTGAPFDSYLTLRGLRTLHARLRIHQENAAALAELLATTRRLRVFIIRVLRRIRDTTSRRASRMASARCYRSSSMAASGAVRAFVDGLSCFTLAESLGGVESLIAHPRDDEPRRDERGCARTRWHWSWAASHVGRDRRHR